MRLLTPYMCIVAAAVIAAAAVVVLLRMYAVVVEDSLASYYAGKSMCSRDQLSSPSSSSYQRIRRLRVLHYSVAVLITYS